MGFIIEKAKKEKLPIKVLISGPSGSGKTYTALRLATGLLSKTGGKIALIDTEGERGKLYGNEFNYFRIPFSEPYTPERYIEAIDFAKKEGATIIIIDSLSHEWTYLNELVNNMPGNSFQNWGIVKPRHFKMRDKINKEDIHIIATGRGKDEYVMELNEKGKQQPKKVGVGVQQEKDTEYEYMVTFNLSQNTHVANVMKDNTHLFEGRYDVLTEKDGQALYDWANSGEEPTPKTTEHSQVEAKNEKTNVDILEQKHKEVITLAKSLGGSKNKEVVSLTEQTLGMRNSNLCEDEKKLDELISIFKNKLEERGE